MSKAEIQALKAELALKNEINENLEKESSFYRAIIEHTAEGVCVCHSIESFPYVQFTVWNVRMLALTGYSVEEINRLGWYQTMYPDPSNQAKAIERMNQMRVGQNLHGERWEIVRKDGKQAVLSISTALLTFDTDLTLVLGLMQDVTEDEIKRQQIEKEVTQLKELLPICSSCKSVRDEQGFWHDFETYLDKHLSATVTHGICPVCVRKLYPDFAD